MSRRKVGAAVVIDPELPGPGVITERDILRRSGRVEDPDTELVARHLTAKLTFASPDWSLEQAAAAMVRGGFRHLIVVDGGELVGSCRCETSSAAGPRRAQRARFRPGSLRSSRRTHRARRGAPLETLAGVASGAPRGAR